LIRIAFVLFLVTSCQPIYNKLGGDFDDTSVELSPKAKDMVIKAFEGLENVCLVDSHIHLAGLGNSESGIYVKRSNSLLPDFKQIKLKVYMSASGVKDEKTADQEFIHRLVHLFEKLPGKWKGLIYAFDYFHDESGKPIKEKSSFHIPNEYAFKIASQYPEYFVPVISIHPDKKDALSELSRWREAGARFVKWLPNAQRIDPSSPNALAFLRQMKEAGMVLITHIGEERAVEGDEYQHLGNPLLFRQALEQGNKIIMAHLGSLGICQDIDDSKKTDLPCIDLFYRLMTEPKYQSNLFGEISGLTIHTRVENGVQMLLQKPEFSNRIVNGSDYPLPAVNLIYRTGQIHELGMINTEEKSALNEIYKQNPLLFDFVLKRTLRNPTNNEKIPLQAFLWKESLPEICN
jgi:predicted TIM-barrel fold metal-dependent hydrolase